MKIKTLDNKNLHLTNSGQLELFFIGTGSAFTKRQSQTNLLIIKGENHLLIDCGTKCPQALFELGLPVTQIKNFLITHSHADHIGGLEEVALMGRYFTKKKPAMVINETYQQILWDMSLRGGIGFNEDDAGDLLNFHDFFDIIRPQWLSDYPRETFGAKVGDIDLKMMRTKHIPDTSKDWQSSFWSCGVVIDERILFTSDTKFDAELLYSFDEKFHFETIFHDCQFYKGGVHASLEELKTLPEDLRSRMILTHYGDNWENFENEIKAAGFLGLARQQVSYLF